MIVAALVSRNDIVDLIDAVFDLVGKTNIRTFVVRGSAIAAPRRMLLGTPLDLAAAGDDIHGWTRHV